VNVSNQATKHGSFIKNSITGAFLQSITRDIAPHVHESPQKTPRALSVHPAMAQRLAETTGVQLSLNCKRGIKICVRENPVWP